MDPKRLRQYLQLYDQYAREYLAQGGPESTRRWLRNFRAWLRLHQVPEEKLLEIPQEQP